MTSRLVLCIEDAKPSGLDHQTNQTSSEHTADGGILKFIGVHWLSVMELWITTSVVASQCGTFSLMSNSRSKRTNEAWDAYCLLRNPVDLRSFFSTSPNSFSLSFSFSRSFNASNFRFNTVGYRVNFERERTGMTHRPQRAIQWLTTRGFESEALPTFRVVDPGSWVTLNVRKLT
jgi:hypothetical protein